MTRTKLFALAAALVAVPVVAEDKPKFDQQAMFAEMMRVGTPGPEHKILQQLEGKWTYTGEMWMDPSQPPQALSGTAERKMILGGRFLQDTITGPMPGAGTFEGLGYTGYDNAKKAYVGVWMDNMSTSAVTSQGKYDAATKTLKSEGECYCPVEKKNCKTRDVTTITSADSHTVTAYKVTGGKEEKCMTLNFKRVK